MSAVTEASVIKMLKQCMDPEVPIDLWNLGLIYDIRITENENGSSHVMITMTLTTPGCAMKRHMAEDIQAKVKSLDNVGEVEVEFVCAPVWNTSMMSPEAREKLQIPDPGIIS